MKIHVLACAAFLFVAASTASAEPTVAPATLDAMGLSAMQPLSDEAGLTVRGKGTFANVWGGSTASWGGQTSSNNYQAGSSWLGKPAGAAGSSLSFAGNFGLNSGGFGGFRSR